MKNEIIPAAAILMALTSAPAANANETSAAEQIGNIRQEQVCARCTRAERKTDDYEQSYFREDEPMGFVAETNVQDEIFYKFVNVESIPTPSASLWPNGSELENDTSDLYLS